MIATVSVRISTMGRTLRRLFVCTAGASPASPLSAMSPPDALPVMTQMAPRAARLHRSALLRIDETVAAPDDLVVPALGDCGVHLHLAMALAGYHFGGTTRAFGDLGMVERGGHGIALDRLGFLDRGFPELQAAVGAGGGTAGREQEIAGIILFVGG